MVWMVQNRQWVLYNKHEALEGNYQIEEESATFKGPLTFRSYCQHLLDKRFWGDKVVLYAISAMSNLRITVFNLKTDEEYRVHHNAVMDLADVNMVYNVGNHYSVAGM